MDQVSRRGTPVAAAKVFLWYKTGSEQATSGQRNGGDWFGMKEKGKQQHSSRKQRAFLAVESKRVLVSNSSKVKSRGRLLRSPTRSHAAAHQQEPPCFFSALQVSSGPAGWPYAG
jgi:hypothetical protein